MVVVLPEWIDQVPKVDYAPEKTLLTDLEMWAEQNGWTVNDGSKLPHELRQRTDVLLEMPNSNRRVRVAILRKSPHGVGVIRMDSSNLRTIQLVYRRTQRQWRVEAGDIPIEDNLLERGWGWLLDLMFKP